MDGSGKVWMNGKAGKELPERSETFLAFSQAAVRSLQGRGRISVALL